MIRRAMGFLLLSGAALAASGPPGHQHGGSAIGSPAQRGQGRIITVAMTDYAFSVPVVTVIAGETVRFVISNKGSVLHEFSIDTPEGHAEHRPMMTMMVEHGMITTEKVISRTMVMPDGSKMAHNDPNSVLVEPGKSAELSWKFPTSGTLQISCNLPGHAESGMVAPVRITVR